MSTENMGREAPSFKLMPWEIKRGWYWTGTDDPERRPISASGPDFRLMRNFGLIRRQRITGGGR